MTPDDAANPASPVILVVDDAIETLSMLCDALTQAEYTVLVAQSAEEALERFELVVPDGVLLDAVMPGMDGFELCQRLKTIPPWSHVPVIFMTGLSETEEIVHGFASGGVDYVVKPLRIPEVLARLAWSSPQAQHWLQAAFGAQAVQETTGDGVAERWLTQALQEGEVTCALPGGQRLVARYLGLSGPSESMLLISVETSFQEQRRLQRAALTPRETEVLSWLAKGKTNRDIAGILGMSHRTVNKHLEHIFEKLGVETRSAAAIAAKGG
jgi:DNA-binding response OmpR family regulator